SSSRTMKSVKVPPASTPILMCASSIPTRICLGCDTVLTLMRYVFDTKQTIRYRFPTHTNELVMDRSEAEASEAFMVVLEPGEAPPLHSHDDTEQVFYITNGTGTLQIGADPGQLFPLRPGELVRI